MLNRQKEKNDTLLKTAIFAVLIVLFSISTVKEAEAQARDGILQSIYEKNSEFLADLDGPWNDDIKLQRYLNYYHLQEPVFQTPSMMQRLIDLGYTDQAPEKQHYIIGFFAVVFKDNPELVYNWLTNLTMTQYQAGAYLRAARHAGLTDIINKYITYRGWDYPAGTNFDELPMPLKEDIVNPEDVQRVWGAYIAEGDKVYLDKLYRMMLVSDVPLDQTEINKGNYETFKMRSINEVIEGVFIHAGVQYDEVFDYLKHKVESEQPNINFQLRRIMTNVVEERQSSR